MDLYKVLGLRKEATQEEVKTAFRRIALQFHPDRHAQATKIQQEAAARRFREASEAYQVLVDPLKRALYNKEGRAHHAYATSSSPPRNDWHRQTYHASSRPRQAYHASSSHRPFWNLRLSLSPFDVAFHALLAGTIITGLIYGDFLGKAVWDDRNAGKSFEDIVEAKQHREKERKG